MQPEVASQTFKNQWKSTISSKNVQAGGAHSRPTPGLCQGPASSDLHLSNSKSQQRLPALEHHGKCDFQELPALARFFCAFTWLPATDNQMKSIRNLPRVLNQAFPLPLFSTGGTARSTAAMHINRGKKDRNTINALIRW